MANFQEQLAAARSNLSAGLAGTNLSSEQQTSELNRILGSANEQDIARYSQAMSGQSINELIGSNPSNNIVSSTYGIRAEENNNKVLANEAGNDIADMQASLLNTVAGLGTDSESTNALITEYNALRQNLGVDSNSEINAVNVAGKTAGQAYEPLIKQAEEEKRKGMPKALINAGERGGLMSTQFAGSAALAPTEGGTFVGVGGELENVKSAYDAQISNLKVKQQQAILEAQAAQRKANRTGRQEDLDALYKAIDLARSVDKEARDLTMQKVNFVNDYLKDQQAQITAKRKEDEQIRQFNVGEARAQKNQDLQEEKWAKEVTDDTKKETLDNIKRMAESGINLNQLSEDEINTLEILSGIQEGTFEAFYSRLVDQVKQGDTLDDLKVEKAKLDIESAKASIARTRQLMSSTSKSNKFKISTEAKNKLVGANFSLTDIENIEQNLIDGFPIEEIISQNEITGDQANILKSVFAGEQGLGVDDYVNSIQNGGYVTTREVQATDDKGKLLTKADGTPIYTKETTIDIDKIPVALQDDVMARLEEVGFFDEDEPEEEEEKKQGYLSRQWKDLKSAVNPFD